MFSWSTLFAALAAVAAFGAWWTAHKTLRGSYRPVVRPFPIYVEGSLNERAVGFKNVGTGPALGLVVFEEPGRNPDSLVVRVGVVEPLGAPLAPRYDESTRIGNVKVSVTGRDLATGKRYRALYQDTASDWHETQFSVADNGFTIVIRGHRGPWDVPPWVRDLKLVGTESEFSQYG